MTTLGVILMILLIISFLPNAYMLYKSKKEGIDNPRIKLMVGIDAILIVFLIAALYFLT
ncbi:MAG: hypothetical protein Q4F01_04330 [Staphylococcus rostri]|uniref:hypothetical protein n=1 Tax=Staphylococcus rostri TaxID=522262 RepID=UPI0026DF6CF3|nr:hypothetical protein [Staphylococcus rostri]MDO5375395.1 hypothetical protein [Staphylococcus rostri]